MTHQKKFMQDMVKYQKMNGVYHTPLGRVARKIMRDWFKKIKTTKDENNKQ